MATAFSFTASGAAGTNFTAMSIAVGSLGLTYGTLLSNGAGALRLDPTTGATFGGARLVLVGGDKSDLEITLTARLGTLHVASSAQAFFRFSSTSGDYGYAFLIVNNFGTRLIAVNRYDNGVITNVGLYMIPEIDDTDVTATLVALGTSIKVVKGGVDVITITSSTYQTQTETWLQQDRNQGLTTGTLETRTKSFVVTVADSGRTASGGATFGVTAAATGAVAIAGAGGATFGLTAASVGRVALAGTAAAAFGVTTAAAGAVAIAGAGAGAAAFGLTGASTAALGIAGAASTSFGLTGTSAGVLAIHGAASALFGVTSASDGTVTTESVTGTGSAAFGLTAASTAALALQGTGAAAFGVTGSAVGALGISGAASATFGVTSAATAALGLAAAGAALFGVSASAAAALAVQGAGAATFGLTATAQGALALHAAASALFGVTSAATGVTGDAPPAVRLSLRVTDRTARRLTITDATAVRVQVTDASVPRVAVTAHELSPS